MNILISFIKLLGGLAVMIYGMKLLSLNLNKFSNTTFKNILEATTSKPFFSLLFGILLTSIIQSSSATTVIIIRVSKFKYFKP